MIKLSGRMLFLFFAFSTFSFASEDMSLESASPSPRPLLSSFQEDDRESSIFTHQEAQEENASLVSEEDRNLDYNLYKSRNKNASATFTKKSPPRHPRKKNHRRAAEQQFSPQKLAEEMEFLAWLRAQAKSASAKESDSEDQ